MKISKKTLVDNNYTHVKTIGVVDVFKNNDFLIEINRHCGIISLRKIIDSNTSVFISDVVTFDDILYHSTYQN